MYRRNKKGFTLIELIVVMAIVAILAVGGFSIFKSIFNNKKLDTVEAVCKNYYDSAFVLSNKMEDDMTGDFKEDRKTYKTKFNKLYSNKIRDVITESNLDWEKTEGDGVWVAIDEECRVKAIYVSMEGIEGKYKKGKLVKLPR